MYLVSYRPPRRVIGEYGYEVDEIGKMPTSMTGMGTLMFLFLLYHPSLFRVMCIKVMLTIDCGLI
jgi:hypothetical protein